MNENALLKANIVHFANFPSQRSHLITTLVMYSHGVNIGSDKVLVCAHLSIDQKSVFVNGVKKPNSSSQFCDFDRNYETLENFLWNVEYFIRLLSYL